MLSRPWRRWGRFCAFSFVEWLNASFPSTRRSFRTSPSAESLVDQLVLQHPAGDYEKYGHGYLRLRGEGISNRILS